MSYRSEDQSLKEPLTMIRDGIALFQERARNRIESGEWNEDHVFELKKLYSRLTDVDLEIMTMITIQW